MDEGALQGTESEDNSSMSQLIMVDSKPDDLSEEKGEWPGLNMGKAEVKEYITKSKEANKDELIKLVEAFPKPNITRRQKIRAAINKMKREIVSVGRSGSNKTRNIKKLWELIDET